MKRTVLGAMGGLLLLSGCETMTATRLTTPRARVDECEKLCNDVGMKLGAFVVMMNSAGCVCEPTTAEGASTSSSGGATAAGAATIAAIEEAQRQQRQSQSSSSHR